jgi:hypothetical protein
VRERIEYHFRVPSVVVFTLYSYSKTLEYHLEYATAGSLSFFVLACMASILSNLNVTMHTLSLGDFLSFFKLILDSTLVDAIYYRC